MNPNPPRLALIPALNEAGSIASVLLELRERRPDFSAVVIDDGSFDDTPQIALRSGATVLPLPYNLGIGGAVQAGFLYAYEVGAEIAVQVDADGQHDPGQITDIVDPVLRGDADVAIGSRYLDGGSFAHAAHRRLLIGVFARLVTAVTGRRFTDTSSSFRAYNRRAIEVCAYDYPQGFLESVESLVTLSRYGLRVIEVPVTIRQRSEGESSLSLGRTIAYTIKVTIAIAMGMMRKAPAARGD
jgi:glycosyltransferase involved in cell wall biosynthesis